LKDKVQPQSTTSRVDAIQSFEDYENTRTLNDSGWRNACGPTST